MVDRSRAVFPFLSMVNGSFYFRGSDFFLISHNLTLSGALLKVCSAVVAFYVYHNIFICFITKVGFGKDLCLVSTIYSYNTF